MASELASMYVSIFPSMSGFRTSVLKELKGVDSDAGRVGASSGGAFSGAFGKAIGGLGSALATALKVGAGAALAGISAAGAVGIKTAAQLETAQIGFTTMLGSGEKAQAFLKDLTNFAATTPFELPGLQQSASQLVATGIATEKVIPIMTTLGNITSGMGTGSEGIKRAVVAIQQMNAAQRISAEDLNQLRDAGVPVYELLAKATGKSTQEVAALASAGKLGKTELDALMKTLESGVGLERFNGLMEQQSKSLSGLASTAKDTFQIGMAGAIAPLIPLLKDGLGGAINWMSDTAFPAVTFGLQETIGGVQSFASAWKANDGDITSSGFPGFMERAGYLGRQAFDGIREALAPLRPVFAAVVGLFQELAPVFAPLLPQVLGLVTAFNPLHLIFQALTPVLPTLVGLVGNLAGVIGGALAQVLPVVTSVLAQLVGILAGAFVQILPTIVMLVGTLSGIFGMLAPLVVHLVEAFAPLITTLVGSLVPVVVNLVNTVLPPVAAVFATIVSAIVPLVTMLADILVPIIQNVVVPIITVAFNVIAEIIKVAIAIVLTVIAGVVWYFQNVLGPVFNWLWQNVVKPVWEGISAAIGAAWTWINDNVFRPIGIAVDVLATGFDDFWHKTIEPVWKGIQDALGTGWTWIKDHVFTPISDFVTKSIPTAFEEGKKAIGKAWDAIRDVVKAPIKFIIDTVINGGVIGAINTVRGWFQMGPLDPVKLPDGFAGGGYTGDGGKYDPAGIVHAGEFVFTKEQTAAAGVSNLYALAESLRGYAGGGLVSPLTNYVITQGFSGLLGHNGIDMAAPTGTPVSAAGPGRVSMAGWSVFGGGNEVHIDHPNGLQTWYAHLNGISVSNGQSVSQGTTVGPVGMTGLATGPHLHYMVLDGGWPFVLDPMPYLSGGGNAGSNPMAAFINPLVGLLDGFLNQVKGAFPGAGLAVDLAVGAVKYIFNDAMKGIGDMITGAGDKKGPKGGTRSVSYGLYDGGGLLPSMAEPQLIQHRAAKPDAVLTDQQWKAVYSTSQQVGRLTPEEQEEVQFRAMSRALEGASIVLEGGDVMTNQFAAKLRLERARRV